MRTIYTSLVRIVLTLMVVLSGQAHNGAAKAQSTEAEIPWSTDLQAALEAGRQHDAVVLLHFFTDSCMPCKMLDSRAFRDPAVVGAMRATVIPVKVNADQQPETVSRYAVTRWPTDVYLFPDGTELTRSISPQKSEDYIGLLQRVGTRNRDFIALRKQPKPATTAGSPAPPRNYYATDNSDPYASDMPVAGASFTPEARQPLAVKTVSNSRRVDIPANTNSASTADPSWRGATEPANLATRPDFSTSAGSPRSVENTLLASAKQPATASLTPTIPAAANAASIVAATVNVQSESPSMDGYCPVSLDERSDWVSGNSRFAVRHRGRVYHLISAEAQQKFLQNPDKYAPMLGGYDLVHFMQTGQLIEGHREYGCWFKGRVYLFAAADNRVYFDDNVIEVARIAEQMFNSNPLQSPEGSNSGRVATAPDGLLRR